MQTVFSHIVQKRFSNVNEDVATDALAFILHSSESARNGMLKLLRGIVADLPDLQFRTQQSEGTARPDMCGFDETEPRVFIENKFWAGLTENQPVSYLRQLAQHAQPTLLLVVAPDAREHTLWRELTRRAEEAGISLAAQDDAPGVVHSIATAIGPMLALTSWTKLLATLELESADDPRSRSDLLQLRALCEAADSDAFVPVSSEETTDQRTPALILQLGTIVQASVDLAVTEGVLNIKGFMPQATWDRIGRYASLADEQGVGGWFGIHFGLWRTYGATPLWLVFAPSQWGRAPEVRLLLEPWAASKGILTTPHNEEFAVAVDIAVGEEKDLVVRDIVERLRDIAAVLSGLKGKTEDLE